MDSRREELVRKLQPIGKSSKGEPFFQVQPGAYEAFAKDHKPAHLEVLAASNRLSWTQSELPAEMELEKAERTPPAEFQDALHAMISAAVLKRKYAVAKFTRRAQQAKNRPRDEALQAALSTVASEPQRFIQTTHALRSIDPRVAYFHPSEGYHEYWEKKRAEQKAAKEKSKKKDAT